MLSRPPLDLPCIIPSLSSRHLVFLLGQFLYHLGLRRPILFLWASLAYLILTFPWAFAKSFELPQPNYHILYFWDLLAFAPISFTNFSLWAPLAHLCLLSTSYDSHGLTTSFFGLPWAHLFSSGLFLLFFGPLYHYSCHTGLMVFLTLLILLSSPLVILLGFFLPLGLIFFAKMGLNI